MRESCSPAAGPAEVSGAARLSATMRSANELRIWAGRPLAQVESEVLAGTEWTGELLRGLYVAEVPEAGLRHGFQVSGASALDRTVTRKGDAGYRSRRIRAVRVSTSSQPILRRRSA